MYSEEFIYYLICTKLTKNVKAAQSTCILAHLSRRLRMSYCDHSLSSVHTFQRRSVKSRWPPCPYMVNKTLKVFFSRTDKALGLNLGIKHRGLKVYQVCFNDDRSWYFTAGSNLRPYTFVWGKSNGKTWRKVFFCETTRQTAYIFNM